MPPEALTDDDALAAIAELARVTGLRRIHVLAWRDLDDVEAGGSEVHIDETASRWAAAGLEVTMRTSHAAGLGSDVHRHGYRVIRRAGRHLVFPRAAIAELAGRHGRRDGLVEIWNGMPFLSPLWVRGPHITFLHHVHGVLWDGAFPENPSLAAAGKLMERRLAPPVYRATPVVTLSESSRQEIISQMRLRSELVRVVHPGIDARYRPGGRRSPEPLAVVVTRLMPSKRVAAVIDAIAELASDATSARLDIIGTGRERDALERRAEERGVAKSVRFLGRVDDRDLLDAYRRAWVVVSASESEGWGMTLTEAAACGTPAVATDIPGHREAVDPERSGVLVPLGAPLAPALRRVFTDAVERERLSAGALDHARQFDWAQTALGTFTALADDARRRAS